MEIKTLPFELKEVSSSHGAGTFTGRASTFGSVDSMGDVVDRGAYQDTIPEFITKGFIAWGHDWLTPIATVQSAEEKADGLYVTGAFHSTTTAQDVRTIARERVAAGKFMGLSIGFEAEEWEERKVDEPVKNRWGEWSDKVRALTKIKLYEVSLVPVPAEPRAGLTAVKGLLEQAYDIPIEAHARQLRVALDEFAARCVAGAAMREGKVGRAISAGRATIISGVSGSLRTHADALDSLVAKTDDEEEGEESEPDPVIGVEPEEPKSEEQQEQLEPAIAKARALALQYRDRLENSDKERPKWPR